MGGGAEVPRAAGEKPRGKGGQEPVATAARGADQEGGAGREPWDGG